MMGGQTVLMVGNFSSSWGATPSASEALAARLKALGWLVITTSHTRRRSARLLDMLRTVWKRRGEYDVACVDVYSGLAFVWAQMACLLLRLLDKPYVLSLHGGALPEFMHRWGWMLEGLVAHSAGVVAQTDYLANILARGRPRVAIIPNGLDVDLYPYRERSTPAPKMVWLRSFHHIYNPLLAVRVLALLVAQFPEVGLTMIGGDKGDGSLEATRAEAAFLGVSHRVDFVGLIPKVDVPAYLDRADVFLNTSDFDNTPVSVEEALACGLCVVSTDIGGIPHLIDDEVDGLLVAPRDADAMAFAVRRVLTEDGLARTLSEGGRDKAQSLDWSVVMPKWEQILRSAAASGAAST